MLTHSSVENLNNCIWPQFQLTLIVALVWRCVVEQGFEMPVVTLKEFFLLLLLLSWCVIFLFHPFCLPPFPYLFILFPPSSWALCFWLALVWLYYTSHAFGGAGLSCVVASRFAQNWHFSCAQKAYGEALVCTRTFRFILHALVHLQSTKPPPLTTPTPGPGDSGFFHLIGLDCFWSSVQH